MRFCSVDVQLRNRLEYMTAKEKNLSDELRILCSITPNTENGTTAVRKPARLPPVLASVPSGRQGFTNHRRRQYGGHLDVYGLTVFLERAVMGPERGNHIRNVETPGHGWNPWEAGPEGYSTPTVSNISPPLLRRFHLRLMILFPFGELRGLWRGPGGAGLGSETWAGVVE
jgi:hypothetical protein